MCVYIFVCLCLKFLYLFYVNMSKRIKIVSDTKKRIQVLNDSVWPFVPLQEAELDLKWAGLRLHACLLCAPVYACVYVYMHIYLCIYICVCMCVCVFMYVCIWMYIYVYVYI